MFSRLHNFMGRLPLWQQIALAIAIYITIPILLGCLYFGAIVLLSSIPAKYEYLHPVEQIQQVEIIYINESDDTERFRDAHVCVNIPEDQQDAFLADLYELTWYNYGNDPPFAVEGACIRITYKNGDFEILSSLGTYFATDSESHFTSRHLSSKQLIPMLIAYGYQEPESEQAEPAKPTPPKRKY